MIVSIRKITGYLRDNPQINKAQRYVFLAMAQKKLLQKAALSGSD
jgi:uncharacterized protein YneF (UPF0154 family)